MFTAIAAHRPQHGPISDDMLKQVLSANENPLPPLAQECISDICRELLQWRETATNRPNELAMALRSAAIEDSVANARQTLRSPERLEPAVLIEACEVLLRHSTHAAERAAASDVLAQMQGAS